MLGSAVLLSLGVLSAVAAPSPGVCQPLSSLSFKYPPVTLLPGYESVMIQNGMTLPRGMRFDDKSNMLIVDRGVGIVGMNYRNDATCKGWEKRLVVPNTVLNHAVELGPGPKQGGVQYQYLYASSQENLFRWLYDPNDIAVVGNPVTIFWNATNVAPVGPDHVVRTILLQKDRFGIPKYAIVSRGASGNWDFLAANPTTGTAQIRRFRLDNVPNGGWAWQQGEIIGWGLRNGVGIAMSKDGKSVWEVDNGPDNSIWNGVDVHEQNPAEEMNKLPLGGPFSTTTGTFYGYPYCHPAWNSSSVPHTNASAPVFNMQTGTLFSVENPQVNHTDMWCNNPKNVKKAELLFDSHNAPLDVVFYEPEKCSQGVNRYGLPSQWGGDAFVTLHGSWNRVPSAGHQIVRVPWSKNKDQPAAPYGSRNGYVPIVSAPDPTKCADNCIRPCGLLWDKYGRLFVSSDDTGEIFVIQKKGL